MLRGIVKNSKGEIQKNGSKILCAISQGKTGEIKNVPVSFTIKNDSILFVADNNLWCVDEKTNSYQKLFR